MMIIMLIGARIMTQAQDPEPFDTYTIAKLNAAIYDVWNNIDPKMLRNFARSIPKHLRDVIKRIGYPLKYQMDDI